MESATSRYEQEILLIKESHARELEKKEELVREYEEKVEQLQIVFDENQQELVILKSDRVSEVTALRHTNPEVVAEQIQSAFGFDYVE